MTTGRSLSWLQNNAEQNVWQRWGVTYRDVWILDPENQVRFVFNLTQNDLSIPENRQTLKEQFLRVAEATDSDGDQLPDAWERRYWGNLESNPEEDSDGDGIDNLTELAFGSQPNNALSLPKIRPHSHSASQSASWSVTFGRPSGHLFDYFYRASADLGILRQSPLENQSPTLLRKLYDGTGTSEFVYSFAIDSALHQFVTLAAKPMPPDAPSQ